MHLHQSNLLRLPHHSRWRRGVALLLAWVHLFALLPAAPVQAAPAPAAVMLEFAAPPTVRIYAAALAADPVDGRASAARAAQTHLARLDAAQRALLPRLAQLDATVLYRTQRVYNGIALLIDRAHLGDLARLPGVKAVHPLRPKTPDLAHSAPHIGGPALWAGLAGLPAVQGEGIRIGVIDTGIDYLHVDFGGPGVGYAENDRRVIGDVVGFPSAKIAGGYDFVGESYNADPAAGDGFQPVPEPDPDPYDCYAHGTHVAGIAGGYGVTADGRTYTGGVRRRPRRGGLQHRAGCGAARPALCAQGLRLRRQQRRGRSRRRVGGRSQRRRRLRRPHGRDQPVARFTLWRRLRHDRGCGRQRRRDRRPRGRLGGQFPRQLLHRRRALHRRRRHQRRRHHPGDHGDASFAAAGDAPASDTVAAFSSRGPRRGDAALKPEIAAPGVAIVSAAAGSGNGARSLSGTSMAAPHVAGALALLRQLHPDWRAAELKALAHEQQPHAGQRRQPAGLCARAASARGASTWPRPAPPPRWPSTPTSPARVGISFGAPDGDRPLQRRAQCAHRQQGAGAGQLSSPPICRSPTCPASR
jgi:subtilisin family serine protease